MTTRFRAMQHRNFQLFIGGQLVSLIGTWMQTTAQLWLVYKLTNSAALLGLYGFANRHTHSGARERRRVRGRPLQSLVWRDGHAERLDAAGICAGRIDAAAAADAREWEIILVAFLLGVVTAFDVPIRQSFFVEMVGKEDLPNAIALNSSIFNRSAW